MAERLCPCTYVGQRCIKDVDHGGVEHESASGVKWPMHLPYVSGEARLREIDRNARAYGWEVGKWGVLAEHIVYSPDNPFIDPNWRDHVQA